MMWQEYGDYAVKVSSEIEDSNYKESYLTKNGKEYHIEAYLFSSVNKKNGFCDAQAYIIEIQLDNSLPNNIRNTFCFIFPNRLVKIKEVGTDEVIRDKMQRYTVLNTEIMLEKGQTEDITIEVDSNIILSDEIQRLEGELKNSQEKRVGFK